MIEFSNETLVAFDRRMDRVGVDPGDRVDYRKRVRFYLDFCQKHGHPPRNEGSLDPFFAKLASKNQSEGAQRDGAGKVRRSSCVSKTAGVLRQDSSAGKPPAPLAGAGPHVGHGTSWANEYRDLEGAIKMRNYSGKTFAAYRLWVQKFQAFVRSKPAGEVDGEDTKRFLTDVAVKKGVAGSTQNQAFNALLFFYRHVLGREFGKLDGSVAEGPKQAAALSGFVAALGVDPGGNALAAGKFSDPGQTARGILKLAR